MNQDINISGLVTSNSLFYIDDTITLVCTWVFYCVVCQMVNIFGIVTNTINIICLIKQGFKDSTNISLLGLSCSDLASLVTMVATYVFICPTFAAADLSFENYDVGYPISATLRLAFLNDSNGDLQLIFIVDTGLSCSDLASLVTMVGICVFICPAFAAVDLPFEIYDVGYLVSATPHLAFTRISSCITALITLERCLSISKPLKVRRVVTPQRTGVIISFTFLIFTFSAAPIYVVNTLGPEYYPIRNKTIIRLIYQQGREKVDKVTLTVNSFVIPYLTFVIITICTLILVFQLYRNAKWRNTNIQLAQGDKVSSRNQKVAKMVLFISTVFIVCVLPHTIIMLAIAFQPELFINGKYVKLTKILSGITFNMESINCSMNIFIYYKMSTKYRDTFRKIFIGKIH